jgi:hypothetical protein
MSSKTNVLSASNLHRSVMSIDLVESHLKAKHLGNMKFDNFEDVMPKLLNYFSKNKVTDWSGRGCRTSYNNIKIFEILGFQLSIKKIEKKTKGEIKLSYKDSKYKISSKILIPLQDFFQYKVVEYLKKESDTNDKLKQYFKRHNLMDSNEIEINNDEIKYNVKDECESDSELVDDKKLAIEDWNYCDFNSYRVDMLLHITGKYYLCLEFFENHHKNPNEVDLSNELHRIMSLVYNNKSLNKKIVHVGVYWESNFNDEKKFNSFMKKVVINNIEKYWNIDNEKDYIVTAISEELECDKQVAEMLYDSNEQRNTPVIWLDKFVNKIVKWKKGEEEKCKSKVFNKFIKKINQFQKQESDEIVLPDDDNKIQDYDNKMQQNKEEKIYYDSKTDRLTNYGLTLYISYLITSNVLNSHADEEWWNDFNAKITRGFIEGLKKIRKETLSLSDKFMSGLYDCY